MTTIAVIRQTDIVTDDDVKAYCAAQEVQVHRDFQPDWGRDCHVVSKKTSGAWPMYLRDHSPEAGALGWHELDAKVPTGFVFVGDDKKYGLNWTVTASHEILETLGDPTANLVRPYPNGSHVAYEACDPCEADALGYAINGVMLSDFVFQAWFTGHINPKRLHPYDFTGALSGPLTLAAGGYIAIEHNGTWTQKTEAAPAGVMSRVHTSGRHWLRGGFLPA